MTNFLKTIFIIAVFLILTALSFQWFNYDKKELQEVPYVDKFFRVITVSAEWIGQHAIKGISFEENNKPKNRDIDNLILNNNSDLESDIGEF